MARFYTLEIVQDLFGAMWLERRWGRIGSTGQKKSSFCKNRPIS